MKTRLALIGIVGLTLLAAAAPRTWVLKTGVTVTGDYVSSGTTALVVKTGGTNFILKISDLSTDDQAYVAEIQAKQKQGRFDAETNQMAKAGMIEFTVKLIENVPEKVDGQSGWMDADFIELTDFAISRPRELLGFAVKDKNGDSYFYCVVEKNSDNKPNPLVPVIANLKDGDKMRLLGKVLRHTVGRDGRAFHVEKVEMIESAAEKKR